MPAIATPTAARPSRSSLAAPNALRPPTPDSSRLHVPARGGDPRGRGGRLLFEVPFQNAMSDSDLAVLAQLLDLWTHMYPKMRPDPNSPGVARLDHFSGLFLERGAEEGMWVLKARTWGTPAAQSVHEWHVLAAQAAHQLDPRVTVPDRLADLRQPTPDRPLGRAANRRFARLRRRLVGLSS